MGGKNDKSRIFKKINPKWDHDLHIHSNWSQDILDGPSMAEYIPLAERYKVHIGFADHFEWLEYLETDYKSKWKLNPETLHHYLEEIDELKANYSFVSSGLELDYYPRLEHKLQEFVDDYRNDFDLLIGSVHEVEDFHPITVKKHLDYLIQKHGGLSSVLNSYYDITKNLVESEIFDAVAHPDVIFRFFTKEEISSEMKRQNRQKMIELGKICQKNKTLFEINLSGLHKPWNDSSPEWEIVNHLFLFDTPLLIGSDSHRTATFRDNITTIRKYNNLLRNDPNYYRFNEKSL